VSPRDEVRGRPTAPAGKSTPLKRTRLDYPDGSIVYLPTEDAAKLKAYPALLAALEAIANEPCDHGTMSQCPRETARAALALAHGEAGKERDNG
jgi:hypothetical protein